MSRSRAATRKRVRLYAVLAGLAMLGIATALVLVALQDNITFFFGPSEVAQDAVGPGQKFRLGGLVAEGSIEKTADGVTTQFVITDLSENVSVTYSGVLPDLFREKQGVVALGELDENGVFVASEVLAKHDENYMPPEAVEAMKRAGTWRHAEGAQEGMQEGTGE